eukprot:gb/GECH01011736.1/.p1 GENE.gb/GECH01011736.1/~~gb/GECH01011736.1/.p1  ORF type:complete len:492 (+),score=93.38 gb/GECH01011736.1/:1-1476(+)
MFSFATRIFFFTLFFFSLFILTPTTAKNICGGKATLTDKGINHVAHEVLPFVVKQVRNQKIPDVHGDTHVSVLGHIDYSVTHIHLDHFNVHSLSVSNHSPDQVIAHISGLDVRVSLHWHYKQKHFPHISGSGKADASSSGASSSVPVTVTFNKNGKPEVSVSDVHVSLGHFDVHIHGGFEAWLLNLLKDLFKDNIKHSVESSIRDTVKSSVNQLASKALSSLDLLQKVDDIAEVDFSFCSEDIDSKHISFGTKGEFYLRSHPTEAPYKAPSLPNSVNDKMVQLLFSEFVANSAGYVYHNGGKLQYLLTQKDLPSNSPINLNTTDFKTLIPKLYAKLPNAPMQVNISTSKPPTTTISSKGAEAKIYGYVEVEALKPNGKPFNAFTLAVTMDTEASVHVETKNNNQLVLKGKLSYANFDMKLHSTNVGHFNLKPLNSLIKVLLQKAAVPFLNQYLNNGFPIPNVEGVTFIDPEVAFHDGGYLSVSSNINYKPQ